MTRAKWPVRTFAEDAYFATLDPGPEDGDGRIYIVRDVHGMYIEKSYVKGNGFTPMTRNKKYAKPFYEGQAAWGAACRSIYPAEVLVIGRVKKKVHHG